MANDIRSVLKKAKRPRGTHDKKRLDESKNGKDIHAKESNGKSIYKSIVDKATKDYKSKKAGKEVAKHMFWGKDLS